MSDVAKVFLAAIEAEETWSAEGFVAAISTDPGRVQFYGPFRDPISAIEYAERWLAMLHIMSPSTFQTTFIVYPCHEPEPE